MTEQYANFGETTLNEGAQLSATDTSVTVTDASDWPATGDYRVVCEDEIMKVTARTGNTATVERGVEGTTAATHDDGTAIALVLTAGGLKNIIREHSGAGVVGCRLTASGTEAHTTGAYHDITAWTEVKDTDGFYSSGSDIVIPGGLGGTYIVTAGGSYEHDTSGERLWMVRVNGTDDSNGGEIIYERQEAEGSNTFTSTPSFHGATILDLAAGDKIRMTIYHNRGSNLNFPYGSGADGAHLEIFKVGAGGAGAAIGASVYKSADQDNIAAAPTDVKVTWNSTEFDTDGVFDDTNDRLTVPTGLGGIWVCSGVIALEDLAVVTAATDVQVQIWVNGALDRYVGRPYNSGSALGPSDDIWTWSEPLDLDAGDYVEVYVRIGSSTSVDIRGGAAWSHFSLVRQGGSPTSLREGTTFPTSPTTGERYRRTDLDYQVFFYDGTRWVTEVLHTITEGGIATASAWFTGAGFDEDGLDVYLEKWHIAAAVITTHDASNDWDIRLEQVDADGSGGTWNQLDVIDTHTLCTGVSNFTGDERALGDVVDVSTDPGVVVYLTRNGSAGEIRAFVTVFYRYIAT